MSNSYYDLTGVLRLKQVTPIIKALFGGLSLDPDYPGNGEAYFARMSEVSSQSWDDVLDELEALARKLGLRWEPAAGQDSSAEDLLWALARHFKSDKDEGFASLLEASSFEDDDTDLEALFVLARAFDDGHGLHAIVFEGCWHCDKPRLFEFGGDGGFIGRHCTVMGTSTQHLQLGSELDQALARTDMDEAASLLEKHMANLLAGIDDSAARSTLMRTVATRLAAR